MMAADTSSLANRKRPRTLNEVQGHPDTVTTLSLVIQNDLWGQHSPLFLQGAPGSGKTTIALLSARVTLCPHRVGGTSDNCGTCDTCIGKDTVNIEQYTCTGADADALQGLIDKSRSQPLPKAGSPRYRFFILDEVSNMSNQQLSKFLEVLEATNKYNIWVLVSMKPERMDATLSNALLSRCTTFTFPPLTVSELTTTLTMGGVDLGIAQVLSPFCRGNARLAWRQFDRLLLLNPDATPVWVESTLTGGATKTARATMWQSLRDGKVREVIDLLGGWGCDSLISLLREDLVQAMCARPSPIQGKVLHTLTTGREEDVLYILLSYVGEDVMGISTPTESNLHSEVVPITNYARALLTEPYPVTNDGLPILGITMPTQPAKVSEWARLSRKYALVGG
jgi:hypothetical protein